MNSKGLAETLRGRREKGALMITPEQLARKVDSAIGRITRALKDESMKPSVSDLVRLLALRKDLVDEQPAGVTARWVNEWTNLPIAE